METDEVEVIRTMEVGMVTDDGTYHERWIACYANLETGEGQCFSGHEEYEARALAVLYRDSLHADGLS